jgi:hypothetical protein
MGDEWIGARLLLPVYVDEDPPFRPSVALWIDGKSGTILSQQILGRDVEPNALWSTLVEAMEHPMIGPPRKPSRVRVAEAEEGERLRSRLEGIEVTVGATPEVDEIMGAILESMDGDHVESGAAHADQSYFEHGRLSLALVCRFFEKAAALYLVAPWTLLSDSDVLSVDVPELGLRSACLSVLGSLGQNVGFVLFETCDAYRAFISFFEKLGEEQAEQRGFVPVHTGSSSLAVNYSGKDTLSETMQKEIKEHRLRVAGPFAYPAVISLDSDSVPRPVSERDLRLATAVSEALTQLVSKHHDTLEMQDGVRLSESTKTSGGLIVRLTAPHPEISWSELAIDDEEDSFDDGGVLDDLDLAIHTHVYEVVETQIASGDPPETQRALDRLTRQGLSREEAVHAIGVVLVGELMRAMEATALKPSSEYTRMLDKLDADGWLSFGEVEPSRSDRDPPKRKSARRPRRKP